MHAEPDLHSAIERPLWHAVLRRRVPWWLASVVPALATLPASVPAGLALLAGAVAWAAWDARHWRQRTATQWPRWLDDAVPALEDSSGLLATSSTSPLANLQRARLAARLREAVGPAQFAAIARAQTPTSWWPAALATLAAVAVWLVPAGQRTAPREAVGARQPAAVAAVLTMKVVPPRYTGVQPYDTAPRDLQVPRYSAVQWCAKGAGTTVQLGDGTALNVASGACAQWHALDAVSWRSGALRHDIRVKADQPPTVSVAAPTEAVHQLAPTRATVRIAVAARDDYGIARATLHLTLARGSGESIRFSDREVPLPQGRDARRRDWQKDWTLSELGMEPGDELYFFVRATDNDPEHPHTVQSPTHTLRLPGPEAEALDSSALPGMVKPENLRSQRQIIIDTEQLVADMRGKLPAAVVRERSEGIAADQAQLRRRYGQFLGEESTLFGDEHEEHAGHDDHDEHKPMNGATNMAAQFGHAHDMEDNATIFDPQTKTVLRRALSAMWDAEKALRAIAPSSALPPEYKALAAIKALQQAERVYLHRAAFEPPPIKEDKRLSGDTAGAASYRRAQVAASGTAGSADVRSLAGALSGDGALPALWSRTAVDALNRLPGEDAKLAAQRAVQDVADGCVPCRGTLRAWLRATLPANPVLQAQPEPDTPLSRAWQGAPR
ncbi:hypothetical protein ACFFTM_23900 [Pseudoduganella plicata]|uniref:DUF4175 family protein n=1 Tax=Pseudoduganella plicata TaxID=321984 RepID=A0A4P7BJQ5_9BURK|nr:hypothetical protein [Pseudoduganella plicata]QBQ37915.1 hypothetical protein E1742_18320 [Pseudoduganella plicata]GGZ10724.1 hypothetical protein GCM10007388_50210 [Pseudoduganella plicata]